jgi:hypothetical protein
MVILEMVALSPHPRHEVCCPQILTPLNGHQMRHRHRRPSMKDDREMRWGRNEEKKQDPTDLNMASQHSLTDSCLHIPHSEILPRSRYHSTIGQDTNRGDPLMKDEKGMREKEEMVISLTPA